MAIMLRFTLKWACVSGREFQTDTDTEAKQELTDDASRCSYFPQFSADLNTTT